MSSFSIIYFQISSAAVVIVLKGFITDQMLFPDYGERYTDINAIPRGPEMLTQTRDTSILGGTTKVYLDCVARASPAPMFYWTRQAATGVEIVTSDLDSRYTVTNGRLSIQDPVENMDAGIYQCGVASNAGTIIGAPMQLSFVGKAKEN